MDWVTLFIIILSALIFLFFLGVPVAYSFLFINILFAYIFWGEIGLTQLILSIFRSISSFSLLPVPLFLLMGEIMFLFGIAQNMMETLEKWMGRLPGRLSLFAVVGGVYICDALRVFYGRLCHARTNPITRNGEEGI